MRQFIVLTTPLSPSISWWDSLFIATRYTFYNEEHTHTQTTNGRTKAMEIKSARLQLGTSAVAQFSRDFLHTPRVSFVRWPASSLPSMKQATYDEWFFDTMLFNVDIFDVIFCVPFDKPINTVRFDINSRFFVVWRVLVHVSGIWTKNERPLFVRILLLLLIFFVGNKTATIERE